MLVLLRFPRDSAEWSAWLTAAATAILAVFTVLLAIFTRQLAAATRQPSVVVTLEPNRHAVNFFDIHVTNEGTASAFDIKVSFDPPIRKERQKDGSMPLSELSVLRPDQTITSFLTEYKNIEHARFKVNVSWKAKPHAQKRDTISYSIDMDAMEGFERLGDEPELQAARELKRIREALEGFGRNRLPIDVYTERERLQERRAELRRYREFESKKQKK